LPTEKIPIMRTVR